MAKPTVRIQALQWLLIMALAVIIARSFQIQIWQRDRWRQLAGEARTAIEALPARRGTIFDRHGTALAEARELYRLEIAPNEVRDTNLILTVARESLGIARSRIIPAFQPGGRRWLYFGGPFTASQVMPLRGAGGVYLTPLYRRNYPSGSLARAIVGSLAPDSSRGASGMELMFDSLLSGTPGAMVYLLDRGGAKYHSPGRLINSPVDGLDLVLTIDADLQAIAQDGLAMAVDELKADGGDVIFLEPKSGEILAVASISQSGGASAGVFTDQFEPGSTAKLFTAAALLETGRFVETHTVPVSATPYRIPLANGSWRSFEDVHPEVGDYSLAKAIERSSNIAMVQFQALLKPEEHFETLRAFGFGSPTGVEFPHEAAGVLPRPEKWRPGDQGPSIAMGYAIAVTPLQLALAYAAIANNGVMPTPTLVREVIAADGEVVYRHRPENLRRVVRPEVAAKLLGYLNLASSEAGTGGRARLAEFEVPGKTGTARRLVNGRYTASYVASFAGIFPIDDPQLVVIVKIDNPRRGPIYGGEVAAPLTRWMLEQALQAPRSALDRRPLSRTPNPDSTNPSVRMEAKLSHRVETVRLDSLGLGPKKSLEVVVPEVAGLSIREAARIMHAAGLRIELSGSGKVTHSTPQAGAAVASGSVITLVADKP